MTTFKKQNRHIASTNLSNCFSKPIALIATVMSTSSAISTMRLPKRAVNKDSDGTLSSTAYSSCSALMELLRTTGFFNCLSQTIQTNNQYLLHVAEKGKSKLPIQIENERRLRTPAEKFTSGLWYHNLWTWQVPQVQVLKL